jgi:uncharacterized protein (TIGR00255 family)
MTGYGRSQMLINGFDILIEIKSVNHRYFEYSSRIPKAFGYAELPLKQFIRERVTRGKVEAGLYITRPEGRKAAVSLNKELAAGYLAALRDSGLSLEDDLKLSDLVRFSDIFNVEEVKDEEQEVIAAVLTAAEPALEAFCEMRRKEGENLRADISKKLDELEKNVCMIEKIAPEQEKKYYNKLVERIQDLLPGTETDPQRIVTEAAIFAEKAAIDEEVVRLHSHISQMRELIQRDEPVGKKLDFIIQEMNREANTTGSKSADIEMTNIVVEMKSVIEKIREQIQNVE